MEQQPPAYYYADAAGQQAGPAALGTILDLIVDGELAESTLVWWDGLADWISLDSNEVLVDALARRRSERGDTESPEAAGDQPDEPQNVHVANVRGDAPNYQAFVDSASDSNAAPTSDSTDPQPAADQPLSFWTAPAEDPAAVTEAGQVADAPAREHADKLAPADQVEARPGTPTSPLDPGDRPAWAMPAAASASDDAAPGWGEPGEAPEAEPAWEAPEAEPAWEAPEAEPDASEPSPASKQIADSTRDDRAAFAALAERTAGFAAERAKRRRAYTILLRAIDEEFEALGWSPAATGRWVRGGETLALTTSLLGADWPEGSPAVAELVVSHSAGPGAQTVLWPLDAEESEHRAAFRGAVDLLTSD